MPQSTHRRHQPPPRALEGRLGLGLGLGLGFGFGLGLGLLTPRYRPTERPQTLA